MKLALPLMALLLSSCTTAPEARLNQPSEWRANFSEQLYYASLGASGSNLCDQKRRRHDEAQFERRFGRRVRAVLAAHDAFLGPDPEFIIVTACLNRTGTAAAHNKRHALAMENFDRWLRSAERHFGVTR